MIPSATAISGAAIMAVPSSLGNSASATLRSRFRFEAVPTSAYMEFVRGNTRLVYAIEIERHQVPDRIVT